MEKGELMELDKKISDPIITGAWGGCHIQGIAVDCKKGYIYYSFTTKLIKATLKGEIIGSLDGLVGHLGCIAFNEQDGCLYGSLEYKNDIIGKDVRKVIGSESIFEDAFYVVKIDVDKIAALDMSADDYDILTAVYLPEVLKDYKGKGSDSNGNIVEHKFGCSGIDGLTFGPMIGNPEDKGTYLYVAYGVYNDLNRNDNDHQVILCYDMTCWNELAMPLSQKNLHHSGFEAPLHKFFVYTGNTDYGVQNLEYDKHTNMFFMAAYKGFKKQFPNYTLFAVDASSKPEYKDLTGTGERGEVLKLCYYGEHHPETGVRGWHFPLGSTGLYSFGNGHWLICRHYKTSEGQCGEIRKYKWNERDPFELI